MLDKFTSSSALMYVVAVCSAAQQDNTKLMDGEFVCQYSPKLSFEWIYL